MNNKVIRLTAVGFAPNTGYCGFEYAGLDEMFFLHKKDAEIFIETCLSERFNGRHQSKKRGNNYVFPMGESVKIETVELENLHKNDEICTSIKGYIKTGVRGYHAERERESDLYKTLDDAIKASSDLDRIENEPFLEIKRVIEII